MGKHITDRIRPGDMTVHRELAAIPLLSSETGGPDYITLKKALADGSMVVTEVCQGGSVPELKVVNSGTRNVLMLDPSSFTEHYSQESIQLQRLPHQAHTPSNCPRYSQNIYKACQYCR
jgi:hypothetical protein